MLRRLPIESGQPVFLLASALLSLFALALVGML